MVRTSGLKTRPSGSEEVDTRKTQDLEKSVFLKKSYSCLETLKRCKYLAIRNQFPGRQQSNISLRVKRR